MLLGTFPHSFKARVKAQLKRDGKDDTSPDDVGRQWLRWLLLLEAKQASRASGDEIDRRKRLKSDDLASWKH